MRITVGPSTPSLKRIASGVILGAFALFVAWRSALFSYTFAYRDISPLSVIRLIPGEPLASLTLLDRESQQAPAKVDTTGAVRTIADALKEKPLSAKALRLLAVQADLAGDANRGLVLATLGERVSRRDILLQLMLIESSIQQSDISGALSHYDRALRVKPASSAFLYPILVNAISDQEIRTALIPYVDGGAPWILGFLTTAVQEPANAGFVADLLIAAREGRRRAEIFDNLTGPVLTALVGTGDLRRAHDLFLGLPGARAQMLADAGFSEATVDRRYGSFAWRSPDTVNTTVTWTKGSGIGRMEPLIFVNVGKDSDVLERTVALRPGRYAFTTSVVSTATGKEAWARWELNCIRKGAVDTSNVIWSSDSILKPDGLSGELLVPADCQWQRLQLRANGGRDQQGLEFSITNFTIKSVKP